MLHFFLQHFLIANNAKIRSKCSKNKTAPTFQPTIRVKGQCSTLIQVLYSSEGMVWRKMPIKGQSGSAPQLWRPCPHFPRTGRCGNVFPTLSLKRQWQRWQKLEKKNKRTESVFEPTKAPCQDLSRMSASPAHVQIQVHLSVGVTVASM